MLLQRNERLITLGKIWYPESLVIRRSSEVTGILCSALLL
jgi:hypothetical protein